MMGGGAEAAGATCQTTPLINGFTAGTTAGAIGDSANHGYAGTSTFTVGSTTVICAISYKLSRTAGDISGKSYYFKIWSMTDTALNEVLTTTAAITGSNSWSQTEVKANLISNLTLSAGTNYAITVDVGGGAADGTNYASGYEQTSASTGGSYAYWNGSTKLRTENYSRYEQLKKMWGK